MKKLQILVLFLISLIGFAQEENLNEPIVLEESISQIQAEDYVLNWEFEFDSETEFPLLENSEDIIAWISDIYVLEEELYTLYHPLEDYQWEATKRENTLIITGK